jgi:hypothetical protein
MRPPFTALALGIALVAAPLTAQRLHPDTISADSARALLGTAPLVVTGLPVLAFYYLGGAGVLVEQRADSGRTVELLEQAHGTSVLMDRRWASPRAAQAALQGEPLPGERRVWLHRAYRYIAPLSVTVMWSAGEAPETWLDRLTPLED